jgi:acyl-CoA synthetase (AMP-forming)/AMP-acid ligase II
MAHLVQLLLSQARLQPEKPFSHCRGRSQSVEKFAQKVAAFTALLIEKCGLCCGDRVAVAAINTDTTFQCMLAVLAGGGLLSLVNWRWSLQVSRYCPLCYALSCMHA